MDVRLYSEYLRDKRGIIDGNDFFSKSAFRSKFVLIAIISTIVCITMILVILFSHWKQISMTIMWPLIADISILFISWFGALQHIQRMRRLFKDELVGQIEAGSPMDIALGIAAGAICDWLACITCAVFSSLVYMLINFK